MAKVRTLSRKFLKEHPRAGEDTFFVEQVLNCLIDLGIHITYQHIIDLNQQKINNGKLTETQLWCFWCKVISNIHDKNINGQKNHTIRGGHHFKKGDKIQLAVWSGKPYQSPQLKFCPELEVKYIYNFEVYPNGGIEVNFLPRNELLEEIATNDGLSIQDFKDWFKYPSDFDGQIIVWGNVKY